MEGMRRFVVEAREGGARGYCEYQCMYWWCEEYALGRIRNGVRRGVRLGERERIMGYSALCFLNF
tara:strand:+ start:156 stop:350 length:195 start_codon:yes stop_codon:yes gene_type:complete